MLQYHFVVRTPTVTGWVSCTAPDVAIAHQQVQSRYRTDARRIEYRGHSHAHKFLAEIDASGCERTDGHHDSIVWSRAL